MDKSPKVIQIAIAQADNDGPSGVVALDDTGRVMFRAFVERDPMHWMVMPPLPAVQAQRDALAEDMARIFYAIKDVVEQTEKEIGHTTDTEKLRKLFMEGLVVLGYEAPTPEDAAHG